MGFPDQQKSWSVPLIDMAVVTYNSAILLKGKIALLQKKVVYFCFQNLIHIFIVGRLAKTFFFKQRNFILTVLIGF